MKQRLNPLKPLKPALAVKPSRWQAYTIKALALSLLSAPSLAAQPMNTHMVYEVYAGGIHAVQAKLNIRLTEDDRYDITLSAKTRGMLGKLAPWHGTFESNGWRVGDVNLRPEMHRSITTWRDEEASKTYNYNRDGSFRDIQIKDFDKPLRTEKPDIDLTKHSTDALSATLESLLSVSAGQGCAHEGEVFDGKRRFVLKFTPVKQDVLQASRYNIYEGASVACSVEVMPKGGAWHKKPRGWMSIQEQGRDKGMMPTVWMAQVTPDAPAVPIKILVKTNYGSLFMHLAEYHREGQDIRVAEKRVTEEDAE